MRISLIPWAFATKRKVYVDSPSQVPYGFKLEQGPRGGAFYENGVGTVGIRGPKFARGAGAGDRLKPKPGAADRKGSSAGAQAVAKQPDKPKPKKGDKPKAPPRAAAPAKGAAKPAPAKPPAKPTAKAPAKQPKPAAAAAKPAAAPGRPLTGRDDPNLPPFAKALNPKQRDIWVGTYNLVLQRGGTAEQAATIAGKYVNPHANEIHNLPQPGRGGTKMNEHLTAEDIADAVWERLPTEADIDAELAQGARQRSRGFRLPFHLGAAKREPTSIKEFAALVDAAKEHGHALGEKCDACGGPTAIYMPWGGATSFDELDAYRESQEMAEDINQLSYQFQAIINNVMASELKPNEKAAAVAAAAGDVKQRLDELPDDEGMKELADLGLGERAGRRMGRGMLGKLNRLGGDIKALMKWGNYEDDEAEDGKALAAEFKEMGQHGQLLILDTKEGGLRWVTYSSNSFEDDEAELFSQKALTDAVAYGDLSGERGPLRLFHVPGADIGHCDFQAMSGGFLIESGVFADTTLGASAKEYFKTHRDTPFGVSIGYLYKEGDEADGVYDFVRIKERSIMPRGMQANPWTAFSLTLGGKEMNDPRKASFLKEVLGDKQAGEIITLATEATKALESAGVRHKEDGAQTAAAVAGATPAAAATATPAVAATEATPAAAAATGDTEPEFGAKELGELLTGIKAIGEGLKASNEATEARFGKIEEAIKELSKSDDERIAAILAPRRMAPAQGSVTNSDRGVMGDNDPLVMAAAAKEAASDGQGAKSPVSRYIQNLGQNRVFAPDEGAAVGAAASN